MRTTSAGFVVETPTGPWLADAVVVASGAFGRPRIPAVAAAIARRDPVGPHRRLPEPGRAAAGWRPRRRRRSGRPPDRRRAREDRPPGLGGGRPSRLGAAQGLRPRPDVLALGERRLPLRGGGVPGPRPASTRSPRWRAGAPTISTSGPSTTMASGWSATSRRSTAQRSRSRRISTGSSRPATTTPGPSSAACATSRDGGARTFPSRRSPATGATARCPRSRPSSTSTGRGITSVVWATGYRPDYDWLAVDGALGDDGAPIQVRGVSPVAGLYFVGIHRMYEAAAGTVLGCGWVAEYVADRIAGRGTAGGR